MTEYKAGIATVLTVSSNQKLCLEQRMLAVSQPLGILPYFLTINTDTIKIPVYPANSWKQEDSEIEVIVLISTILPSSDQLHGYDLIPVHRLVLYKVTTQPADIGSWSTIMGGLFLFLI